MLTGSVQGRMLDWKFYLLSSVWCLMVPEAMCLFSYAAGCRRVFTVYIKLRSYRWIWTIKAEMDTVGLGLSQFLISSSWVGYSGWVGLWKVDPCPFLHQRVATPLGWTTVKQKQAIHALIILSVHNFHTFAQSLAICRGRLHFETQ